MTDKKTFGSFIKQKRTEKNYSQKDLAEMLFVSEGAISKWERGVSYPDITLISDICRALDISEHELITASTDTDTRRLKNEARKFRVIRNAWFFVPTISYAVALVTCFICNLAVSHKLSWFFVVLSALLCAYTFVPSFTYFSSSKKFLIFSISTYLSISLLLLTCSVYTGNMSWVVTACIGILIGYVLLFAPILLNKTKVSRYKFLFSFVCAFALTVLLLINVNAQHPFMLDAGILVACYAFAPAILSTVFCLLRIDAFLKAGVCIFICTVPSYFTGRVVDTLFGIRDSDYSVDFSNWSEFTQGNVLLICLVAFLFAGFVFTVVGISRICKKRKP